MSLSLRVISSLLNVDGKDDGDDKDEEEVGIGFMVCDESYVLAAGIVEMGSCASPCHSTRW